MNWANQLGADNEPKFKLKPEKSDPVGEPGKTNASHAEAQTAVDAVDGASRGDTIPITVSKWPCEECHKLLLALARDKGVNIVVSTDSGTAIYSADPAVGPSYMNAKQAAALLVQAP